MPNPHQVTKLSKLIAAGTASTSTALAELHHVAPLWAQSPMHAACWGFGAIAALAATSWGLAHWIGKRPKPICEVEIARDEDFTELRKLAIEFFGDKVTSLERMRIWASQRKDLFYCVKLVYREAHVRRDTLEGYYCLLPLTSRAVTGLRSQRITINDLDAGDIAPSLAKTAAIYVGAIAAKSAVGRSVALNSLRTSLHKLAGERRQMLVITRPVTADGMRLVKYFGLKPAHFSSDEPALGALHFGPV